MSFSRYGFIDQHASLALPTLLGVENAVPSIPYGSFLARFERKRDLYFLRVLKRASAVARPVAPDFQAIRVSPPMPLMRRSRTAPDRRANRILRQDAQTTSVRPADV